MKSFVSSLYTKSKRKTKMPYQQLKSIPMKRKSRGQYMKEFQSSLKKENDYLSLPNNVGDNEHKETDTTEEIEN